MPSLLRTRTQFSAKSGSSYASTSSVFSTGSARAAAKKLREWAILFLRLDKSTARRNHRDRRRSPHTPVYANSLPRNLVRHMPNVDLVDTERYETQRPDQVTAKAWDDGSVEKLFEAQNLAKTKLKRIVRNGVPDGIRSLVWPEFLKMHKMPEYEKNYSRAIFRIHGNHLPDPSSPQLFGGSLHTEHAFLTRKGYLHTVRLLSIIAYDYPNIDYCPAISSLIVLLLHHINPDDVLGVLNHMIKKELSASNRWFYFPTYKKDISAFNYVFSEIILKAHPRLHTHLREMNTASSSFWSRWFTDLFIGVFPLHVVFRMLDSFFIEGHKVLLRFGYAYLTLLKDQLLEMNDTEEIRDILTVDRFDLDVDQLVTLAHSFKISKKQILSHRSAYFAKKGIDVSSSITDLTTAASIKLQPKLSEPSALFTEDLLMEVWHHVPNRHRICDLELVFTTKKHGHNINTFYDLVNERQPTVLLIETLDGEVLGAFCSGMWPTCPQEKNKFTGTGETFIFSAKPKFKAYKWVGAPQVSASGRKRQSLSPSMMGTSSTSLAPTSTTTIPQPSLKLSPLFSAFTRSRSPSPSPLQIPKTSLSSLTKLPSPTISSSDSVSKLDTVTTTTTTSSDNSFSELNLTVTDATSSFMMGGNKELVIGAGGSKGQAIWINEDLTRGSTDTCATFDNQPLISTRQFEIASIEVFSFKSL